MTRIADDFSFIRQRLDEIEGKGKPPLGKKSERFGQPHNCDHCRGRGWVNGSKSNRAVPCPYCKNPLDLPPPF